MKITISDDINAIHTNLIPYLDKYFKIVKIPDNTAMVSKTSTVPCELCIFNIPGNSVECIGEMGLKCGSSYFTLQETKSIL